MTRHQLSGIRSQRIQHPAKRPNSHESGYTATAHSPLPTAHWLPPTTYCPLPTAQHIPSEFLTGLLEGRFHVEAPGGQPRRNPLGYPSLSLEGDGPPLEVFVTGTGFIVTPEGLALTNRHVALPWEFDAAARGILESGFEAEMVRFVAYFPGLPAPVEMRVLEASDSADLAVLRPLGLESELTFVPLAVEPPAPGEPVFVLGYPLGLRALMARSDLAFIEALRTEGVTDFWEQAERLSAAGFMAPLASRGIVSQVTAANVVYDAETTSGGSGGPVLTLRGEVVAVNAAILPEFGGSNLGVPAGRARALLERARERLLAMDAPSPP